MLFSSWSRASIGTAALMASAIASILGGGLRSPAVLAGPARGLIPNKLPPLDEPEVLP